MDKYKKSIADNSKVAFIHVSRDSDEGAAKNWAEAEGFPWLTVLPGDVDRSGLMDYYTRRVVPFYTMVDGDGKEVANGSAAVFAKAAEVAKGGD